MRTLAVAQNADGTLLGAMVRRAAMAVFGWLALVTAAAGSEALPSGLDRNQDGQIVIACLGDSNTASGWQASYEGGFPPELGWCEQLRALMKDEGTRVVNLGLGGASVSPRANQAVPEILAFFSGIDQFEYVVEAEPVDVVLLAFGTNDVLPQVNGDPESILDHYNLLWRRGRSRGLLVFVAMTPPVFPHRRTGRLPRSRAMLAETNEWLARTFPSLYRLAFDADVDEGDFMDHVHLNARGQTKRAREAHRALVAAGKQTLPPAGVRAVTWSRGHWGRAAGLAD